MARSTCGAPTRLCEARTWPLCTACTCGWGSRNLSSRPTRRSGPEQSGSARRAPLPAPGGGPRPADRTAGGQHTAGDRPGSGQLAGSHGVRAVYGRAPVGREDRGRAVTGTATALHNKNKTEQERSTARDAHHHSHRQATATATAAVTDVDFQVTHHATSLSGSAATAAAAGPDQSGTARK